MDDGSGYGDADGDVEFRIPWYQLSSDRAHLINSP